LIAIFIAALMLVIPPFCLVDSGIYNMLWSYCSECIKWYNDALVWIR